MAGEDRRSTLGDYFTLQRGTTYKSRLLGQPGPVLLGLATILRNGGFRADSLQTYGGESPDKLLVLPGDLYLSLKDITQSADLLGAVARLPYNHLPGRLTQDTVKLEPRGTDVPLDYLHWLLRTPQYRSYCRSHATGTTNLGLSRGDFLAFPAPEPTPKQQRIVHTLGALDDKIELNRRMNETLEAMARALFKSWFVDFDPVRAKAEGRDPCLPTPIADLFSVRLVDSELGEIPEGWVVGTLGDVAQHLRRGVHPDQIEPGTPYIALEHMPKRCIALSEWGIANGLESNKFRFQANEILFGKLRPYFHKAGVAAVDGVCSTDIVVVAPKSEPWFGFVLEHISRCVRRAYRCELYWDKDAPNELAGYGPVSDRHTTKTGCASVYESNPPGDRSNNRWNSRVSHPCRLARHAAPEAHFRRATRQRARASRCRRGRMNVSVPQ